MALSQIVYSAVKLQLLASRDTAYANRLAEEIIDLGQTTEEVVVHDYYVDGQVTDEAIDFGKVTSPTFVYIRFESRFNGDNSTTEDAHAAVTAKIATSSAITTDHILLMSGDNDNDEVTSNITFSTLADTDTRVYALILGEKD